MNSQIIHSCCNYYLTINTLEKSYVYMCVGFIKLLKWCAYHLGCNFIIVFCYRFSFSLWIESIFTKCFVVVLHFFEWQHSKAMYNIEWETNSLALKKAQESQGREHLLFFPCAHKIWNPYLVRFKKEQKTKKTKTLYFVRAVLLKLFVRV